MYRSPGHAGWMEVPRPHLLGRALIWPGHFDASTFGLFECVKVCWIRFPLGKLHWFLCLILSYFYDPSMLMYRWNSNFVEKVVLEREHGGRARAAIWCLLPCVLYCMEGEFEEIIMKLRWSIKNNNKKLQSKFH